MAPALKLELRFLGFMTAVLGLYSLIVGMVAARHGEPGMFEIAQVNPLIVIVWLSTFGILFALYCINALLNDPRNFFAQLGAGLRAEILRLDAIVARVTIFLSWFCMMMVFSPFKRLIGRTTGFPLDHDIAPIDRTLFFGHDAWQVTHTLFGAPLPTMLLEVCYDAWFILVWLSIIYCIVKSGDVALRTRYSIAFVLCWILVGSLAAYFLASAGPCFYQRAFGDAHFAPLMHHLSVLNQQIAATMPNMRLQSLDTQNWLWQTFAGKSDAFGAGISAMPSVHVAVATLMARASFEVDRRSGYYMSGFAVLIWIASIHLGWHYASDGIIGAAMALAIWKLSVFLADRFVLNPRAIAIDAELDPAGYGPAYAGEPVSD